MITSNILTIVKKLYKPLQAHEFSEERTTTFWYTRGKWMFSLKEIPQVLKTSFSQSSVGKHEFLFPSIDKNLQDSSEIEDCRNKHL